jgi:hypothetical protein
VTWMKETETWYSSVPEAGKSSLPKQHQLLTGTALEMATLLADKSPSEREKLLSTEVPDTGLKDCLLWSWLKEILQQGAVDARSAPMTSCSPNVARANLV